MKTTYTIETDYKLSILIPTLPSRRRWYHSVAGQLATQLNALTTRYRVDYWKIVELVNPNDRTDITIGAKRNEMMSRATGDYLCFVDDDDRIADNYIELVMAGVSTNPDCCSLNGIITTDGKDPKPFKHSIDYKEMYEADGVYYRPPNHLNVVRSSIAKQMVFPDWQRSEDSNYCFQLRDSGLLKVEYKIPETLYFYDYVSDKRY